MPYSIVSDLIHVKSNATIAQMLTIPQYRKKLKKALTPQRKSAVKKGKGKGKEMLIGATTSHTPIRCRGYVSNWSIEIIIDSGSSISIISKAFVDHMKRTSDKVSTRTITSIHGD